MQILDIEESIGVAQKMVRRNVIGEVEGVNQTTLIAAALAIIQAHSDRLPDR